MFNCPRIECAAGSDRIQWASRAVNLKTKEESLTSIVNPSYAIDRFTYYMVTTKDGRMYDAVISNETPGIITLRGGSDEGEETILRANIAQMRASSLSLRPDSLEKGLGARGWRM